MAHQQKQKNMWTQSFSSSKRDHSLRKAAPSPVGSAARAAVASRAGYLCRNLPGCRGALEENNMSCCAYRPRAAESLRLMLRHCESYTSVYWRAVGDKFPPYDQVPAYGVRVDFEIPVTTRCLQCEDRRRGAGGTCGFDPATRDFVCICDDGRNSTTDCAGGPVSTYHASAGVVAASVVFSVSAAIGITGLLWYIRKIKSTTVVTCGVQSNENRFF
uniref:Wall-associated receptor kinase C-terminal domain-containing protein n=1 Tax=Oryza brachyantha TaxID=4533 RepID=J3ME25_ORYBR